MRMFWRFLLCPVNLYPNFGKIYQILHQKFYHYLKEYERILTSDKVPIDVPEVVIDTGEHSPKWSQPYQTTEFKRQLVNNQ